MITRTGALLVLAIGAWSAGGFIALRSHWHPFSHGDLFSHGTRFSRVHLHGREEVHIVVPPTAVRMRRPAARVEMSTAVPRRSPAPVRVEIKSSPARRGIR